MQLRDATLGDNNLFADDITRQSSTILLAEELQNDLRSGCVG